MAISENRKFLIALSHFPKFGARSLTKILRYFSDPEAAFKAPLSELCKAGIREKIASEFIESRKSLKPDDLSYSLLEEGIRTAGTDDKEYPTLLKEIYDPPPLLYYKGTLDVAGEISLAIVGTRRYSSYGQRVAEKIASDLAQNGFTLVSGLALGIDTLVHSAAVRLNLRTIAVLGTGVDAKSVYPSANRPLAERISGTGGALISEFPPGTEPQRHHFPQRNRIISGLSIGTLVIEAGEKSGALITARYGLEQNREIFAIPGSIFSPVSVGPNNLIKQGAKCVMDTRDILDALDFKAISAYIDNKKIIPETKEEKTVLALLDQEPKHINEIIRESRLTTSQVSGTLVVMEIKGMVRDVGGRNYVLISNF